MTVHDIEQLLRSKSTSAIRLIASDDVGGCSKLGGLPDVPPAFEWPHWNGKPLAFIAQLDLTVMPRLEALNDLPSAGILYFFYDQEQTTWGFDPKDQGSWKVIYFSEVNSLRKEEAPLGLANEFIYPEKPITTRLVMSYPSFERIGVDLRSLPDTAFDLDYELKEQAFGNHPEHQVGGFPSPVQGDGMELESQLASNGLYCGDSTGYNDPRAQDLASGANDWLLLLQVDTDDDIGMMWGDCGRLYFWITRSALAARDFSRVWMILQCG